MPWLMGCTVEEPEMLISPAALPPDAAAPCDVPADPEAPLGAWLADAPHAPTASMAVIASATVRFLTIDTLGFLLGRVPRGAAWTWTRLFEPHQPSAGPVNERFAAR